MKATGWLILFSTLLVLTSTALAHGVGPLLSYTPENGLVRVEIRDALSNPVSGMSLKVSAGESQQRPKRWNSLREESPGIYTGSLKAKSTDQALHLSLEWAGERLRGDLPLKNGQPLQSVPITMDHEITPPDTPWWFYAAIALSGLLLGWGVWQMIIQRRVQP